MKYTLTLTYEELTAIVEAVIVAKVYKEIDLGAACWTGHSPPEADIAKDVEKYRGLLAMLASRPIIAQE